MSTEQSDEELLAEHVTGDPHAFAELVYRHRDRLWAVALRTMGDSNEAEDALQEALISAFRRAEQFRGEAKVTTWLHRIVVNACLDRIRRRSARPTSPLAEHDTVDSRLQPAQDHIEQRETQILIAEALAELPQDQRDAVILVDIEGWPIEDAARMLNCPTGTVKSRCSRGRAKLAKRLVDLRNPQSAPPVQSPEGGPS
ncbi:MAG: RNA polymerase sigma factor SigM [Actinomycetota bacterium]|nr:RNA polymerase sigma factor SigM [Actinomycetota bacterium]